VSRFWEKVMLVLVVCVPVPALALSGLSVPLPSVVERVAAALVPFGDTTVLDGASTQAAGRIVLTADTVAVEAPVGMQAAATEPRATSPTSDAPPAAPATKPGRRDTATKEPRTGTVTSGATVEEETDAPASAPAEPAPATPEEPTGRDPAPAPAPTPAPVPPTRMPTKEPTKIPDVSLTPVADAVAVVDTTPVPEPDRKVDPPAPADPPRMPLDTARPVKDAAGSAAGLEDRLGP
jgi:hypothetical protein